MAQKSGSAKSGGSRSAKKGGRSTSSRTREKLQASRGEAFQSPAQRAQVQGQSKGPGPVSRKQLSEAEDRQKRIHASREAKAQVQARGASEAEANRVAQDAYDNPHKYDVPPPIGSDEERELLAKLGKDQPGGGDEFTAGYAAEKSSGSAKRSGSRSKGTRKTPRRSKGGPTDQQLASASASAKAEMSGEKTAVEGKGEPSI
jgi:hypothetical protein